MPASREIIDTQLQSGPPAKVATGRPTPKHIGGYEIKEELGRGGMGIVYRAFDSGLKRYVALKVLSGGADASLDALVRFRGEAEVIARLQHPHIVQIYDSGQHDGQQFLVLELVEGGSLDKHIAGAPQYPRDAATTIETLARAVAVAHAQGIVHRDLKPANVLRSKEGTLKITDFGLAKQLDQSMGVSHSGDIRGTPQYMAPEQAGRRGSTIGPPTDVYALGAMLYELLTGRPPFVANNLLDILDQILAADAASPSRLVPKLPRDLCTICLKCLEKDPDRRYSDATQLADDLRRWLDGLPIIARPLSRSERAVRFVRRHPLPVAFVAAMSLIVTGFVLYIITTQAKYAARLQKHYEVAQKALDEISDSIIHDPRLARDKKLVASVANHFQDLLQSQNELPTANPSRMARAHEIRGKLLSLTAEPHKAAVAYRQALDLLTAANEDLPDRSFVMARINLELGMQHRELRQYADATAAYDDSARLLCDGPAAESVRCRRMLAEVWHQRGILYDPYKSKKEALDAYNEGLRIRQGLGNDAESIRDLARSHGYIGDVYLGLGDKEEAAAAYQKSHELRAKAAQAPNAWESRFQLARSHNNFAIMFASSGRWADATARFKEALALQEELVKREADNPEYLSDYAGTLSRLSELKRIAGDSAAAAALAHQAVEIFQPLHNKDREAAMFRSGLADALLQQAMAIADREPKTATEILKESRTLLQGHERNEVDRYHLAAVFALLAEQDGAANELVPQALALLEAALQKGYYRKGRPVILEDRPWTKLRGSAEFKRIIEPIA